jgi:hypothetical protein
MSHLPLTDRNARVERRFSGVITTNLFFYKQLYHPRVTVYPNSSLAGIAIPSPQTTVFYDSCENNCMRLLSIWNY